MTVKHGEVVIIPYLGMTIKHGEVVIIPYLGMAIKHGEVFLIPHLGMTVKHGEVGHDDGHGQRYGQHPRDGTEAAHEHARIRAGHHVPVADGRHGNDGPPQAPGDALEVVLGVHLGQGNDDLS